jgi:hypothetical protein
MIPRRASFRYIWRFKDTKLINTQHHASVVPQDSSNTRRHVFMLLGSQLRSSLWPANNLNIPSEVKLWFSIASGCGLEADSAHLICPLQQMEFGPPLRVSEQTPSKTSFAIPFYASSDVSDLCRISQQGSHEPTTTRRKHASLELPSKLTDACMPKDCNRRDLPFKFKKFVSNSDKQCSSQFVASDSPKSLAVCQILQHCLEISRSRQVIITLQTFQSNCSVIKHLYEVLVPSLSELLSSACAFHNCSLTLAQP